MGVSAWMPSDADMKLLLLLLPVPSSSPDVSSHAVIQHGAGPVIAHGVHQPHLGHAVHHAPILPVHHAAPLVHHAPVAHHAVHAPVAHHAVHAPVVHHAVHAPAPAPYHAPAPAPYHAPAPAPYHAPEPYHEEPVKNYEFGYDVHDYDAYGNPNVHSRHEVRDGYDVKGQYKVELPDCRTQIVDYYVDKYKQYHADVKYVGEICPDKSLAHKPAPAPYHAPAPAPAPYHAP